jgi:glycosyltransferase involved in cell wall biosynthesis
VKLSIVMAVYNEHKTVAETLRLVWQQPVPGLTKELVIVESNSTDGSRFICQKFAREVNAVTPGAVKLILQERPRGKGNAVREGLLAATGDIVLIQDADSEYDPSDYPLLTAPIVQGVTNFVLGSRHLSSGHWKIRQFERSPGKALFLNFGGALFHTFFNVLYGTKLTDPTTMYKVFRRSAIDGLEFVSDRFDFDFELVAKLIRSGNPPLEIPVSYRSRGFEEGKKVRMFADPITWVRAITRFRFSRLYRPGYVPEQGQGDPGSRTSASG